MQDSPASSFKAEKLPFIFEMHLQNSDKDPVVAIQLTQIVSKQKYLLLVSQATINELEGLSKFYETPTELYNQLQQIFEDVYIDSEGVITFQVSIGKTKKRTIKLETQKKSVSIEESLTVLQLKEELVSLKKQIMSEINQLKLQQQINTKQMKELQKVHQLKSLVLEQNRLIDSLKLELQTMKERLNEKINQNSHLGEAVSALSFEIKQIKTAQQQTGLKLQQLYQDYYDDSDQDNEFSQAGQIQQKVQQQKQEHSMKQQAKYVVQKQKQSNIMKQEIKFVPKWVIMHSFDAHPQHPNHFLISKLNHNRYKIQRNNPGKQWNSFIPAFKIFPKRKAAIRVRVTKSQKMQIMLGYSTSNALGQANIWKCQQTSALDFRDGSVWYNGKQYQGTGMVQLKRVVELEIDLMNRTVFWRYLDRNKYTKIREITALPQQICVQELYFHVSMCKNHDLIDIITS